MGEGGFPTPPSNSLTLAGGLTIQLKSDTIYPEIASDSYKTAIHLPLTHISDANCKSRSSPALLTDWM